MLKEAWTAACSRAGPEGTPQRAEFAYLRMLSAMMRCRRLRDSGEADLADLQASVYAYAPPCIALLPGCAKVLYFDVPN
jgi:hypothetical protein